MARATATFTADAGARLPTSGEWQALVREAASDDTFVARLDDRVFDRQTKRRRIDLGYGELRYSFVAWLVDRLNIDASTLFVDVGSGIGQVVLGVAATTGARSIGFELQPLLHEVALANARTMYSKLEANALGAGTSSFVLGDAAERRLPWPSVDVPITTTVVLINNVLFDDTLTKSIVEALLAEQRLPVGTALVVMKPLGWGRMADDELFRHFAQPPHFATTPERVVSWTDARQYPIVYRIVERQGDDGLRARFRTQFRTAYTKLLYARPRSLGEAVGRAQFTVQVAPPNSSSRAAADCFAALSAAAMAVQARRDAEASLARSAPRQSATMSP